MSSNILKNNIGAIITPDLIELINSKLDPDYALKMELSKLIQKNIDDINRKLNKKNSTALQNIGNSLASLNNSVLTQGPKSIMNKLLDLSNHLYYSAKIFSEKKLLDKIINVQVIVYKSLIEPNSEGLENVFLNINTDNFTPFDSMNSVDDIFARLKME